MKEVELVRQRKKQEHGRFKKRIFLKSINEGMFRKGIINLMRKRKFYRGPRKTTYRKRLNVILPRAEGNEIKESKRRNIEIRLALLAGIVSILGFIWTLYQDYKSDKEEIVINSFHPLESSKVTSQKWVLHDRLMTLEFGLLLSNTSDKTISITDYKLEQVAKNEQYLYPTLYSRLDQGMTEPDGKSANMPFILKNGESKLVYIRTGIIVPAAVFSKINEAYKLENKSRDISPTKELTYKELQFYTIKAQTDIYGNKLEGEANRDSKGNITFISSIPATMIHPTFEITFKTASGNYFMHEYHEYQSNKF